MSYTPEFRALSEQAKTVRPGRYRHFKGDEYQVVGIGKNTETLEEYVVYRPAFPVDDEIMSVRPLAMFLDEVDRDDYHGPRFTYLGE